MLEVFSKTDGNLQYARLRVLAIECFSRLLVRHPHFNFRLNILQAMVQKLVAKDHVVRRACTVTIKDMLKKDDNNLLDFKLEILKEIQKLTKTKNHCYFDPSLLDCVILHEIMVDEGKAKAVSASSKKQQQLHDQMQKLRKKGKFTEYKEMKEQLLGEMKDIDAIGLDLGKVSKLNNEIIKEILAIYFTVLK